MQPDAEATPQTLDEVPVDLIRHAHGVHNDPLLSPDPNDLDNTVTWVRLLLFNINGDLIEDGPISTNGMDECEKLRKDVVLADPDRFQNSIIAAAPFKRNLMSALLMFAPILEKRQEHDRYIVVDPALQERNNCNCNIGSSTDDLRAAFEEWTRIDDADQHLHEINEHTLREAWKGSEEYEDGSENRPPLKEIWASNGWVTAEAAEAHRLEEPGTSVLGHAILSLAMRRKLAPYSGLSEVKLLVVGDDITKEDWENKREMVYHCPPIRCFAPFPDLFARSLREARKNMATRWEIYVSDWKKHHPWFKGFDDSAVVVGIIHSGLTAALVSQWGAFRLPKNDKTSKEEHQKTSQEIVDEFEKLKVGDRWRVPRLTLRPEVYGFWTYSREDSCRSERIYGTLKWVSERDGWQVIENPKSRKERTEAHKDKNKRDVVWFAAEQNKTWDNFIFGCVMAPGYVFQNRFKEQVEKDREFFCRPENTISVEFGGWHSNPLRWKWFMGDKETDFTLGNCSAEQISRVELARTDVPNEDSR
ncbi:hypothetical protein MKZ38_002866 [Zalerion maritima]|uniref:Uncharacterized protein n=1 Tax=Zalerion maritima TaxID=339359 RepID=A0AAD5RX17_9PEZI|nr:hypothetical protein MKZ38_002866 [Zalerion maritima]